MDNWWQYTTIYQIYPRSFMDTTGDGVGDLKGIISKLDYLVDLGIETIWISPFYSSPHMDHGYDISDYYNIDPIFGTSDIVEELIQKVHERGMKIVFDMVMNHTSNKHKWFEESRSSVDNPKRDWYIWQPGNGKKKAPNNWVSMTGKKGWNYDEKSNEWYYASFLNFQPDLNYNNPEVVTEMNNVVRFWLDKGVDGFRLDIFNCIGKDKEFKDNPFSFRYIPTPENNDQTFFQHKINSFNHPKSFEFAKELRKVVDEYSDRFLIGEVSGNDEILKKFIGEKHDGLHTVFLFELIHYKFSKAYFKNFIEKVEKVYPHPYIPTYVFSNHDIGRGISRVGEDKEKGKLLALIQLTSRGIPVLYYGDEIGMGNHNISKKFAQDPIAKEHKLIPKWIAKKMGILINRDDCRTPMHWSDDVNGGFSKSNNTWLPLVPDYKDVNVKTSEEDPNSLFNVYKTLLNLRKSHNGLSKGNTRLIETVGNILAYERIYEAEIVLVIINFGDTMEKYTEINSFNSIIFNTHEKLEVKNCTIEMPPLSGVIIGKKKLQKL